VSRGEASLATDRPQPMQGLALELPAALLADPEPGADLRVRLGWGTEQPVSALEHVAVAGGQRAEHRPELPVRLVLVGVPPRVHRRGVGDQVAQRRAVLAHLLIQGCADARRLAQRTDAPDAEPRALGDRLFAQNRRHSAPTEVLLGAPDRGEPGRGVGGILMIRPAVIASATDRRIHHTAYVENFRPR
jgi:hypothetical protein